jgi:hypothetical protein
LPPAKLRAVVVQAFRFPDPPPPKASKNILRATLFHMVGPSGRPLTCASFEVETGLELRLSYGDDVMRWQLFRGVDRDERLAEAANAWRLALVQKGFVEQPL